MDVHKNIFVHDKEEIEEALCTGLNFLCYVGGSIFW